MMMLMSLIFHGCNHIQLMIFAYGEPICKYMAIWTMFIFLY
jgi:hypothetical protein